MPETLTTVTSTIRPDPATSKPAVKPISPEPRATAAPAVTPAETLAVEKPAEPVDPAAKREAELKAREDAFQLQQRKFRNELKKNAEEKDGLGAKLKRGEEAEKRATELAAKLAEREKEDRRLGLNPIAAMEKHLGKEWVKRANELAATGVPPADLIADGMQQLEERLMGSIDERERKAKAAAEEREQSAREQQEQSYQQLKQSAIAEATDFYRQSPESYPIFAFRTLSPEQVGQMLADRIEREARATGAELSFKQAADVIEAEALELMEFVAATEKGKGRLQEKTKPAVVPPSSGVQGVPGSARRTLGNHLTASTSDRLPAKTPAEKLQRARDEYERIAAENVAKRRS